MGGWTMLRSLLGVITGVFAMRGVIAGIEFASHLIYPPPPGLDPMQPQDLKKILAASPVAALAMVVIAWGPEAFAGDRVAARVTA